MFKGLRSRGVASKCSSGRHARKCKRWELYFINTLWTASLLAYLQCEDSRLVSPYFFQSHLFRSSVDAKCKQFLVKARSSVWPDLKDQTKYFKSEFTSEVSAAKLHCAVSSALTKMVIWSTSALFHSWGFSELWNYWSSEFGRNI